MGSEFGNRLLYSKLNPNFSIYSNCRSAVRNSGDYNFATGLNFQLLRHHLNPIIATSSSGTLARCTHQKTTTTSSGYPQPALQQKSKPRTNAPLWFITLTRTEEVLPLRRNSNPFVAFATSHARKLNSHRFKMHTRLLSTRRNGRTTTRNSSLRVKMRRSQGKPKLSRDRSSGKIGTARFGERRINSLAFWV